MRPLFPPELHRTERALYDGSRRQTDEKLRLQPLVGVEVLEGHIVLVREFCIAGWAGTPELFFALAAEIGVLNTFDADEVPFVGLGERELAGPVGCIRGAGPDLPTNRNGCTVLEGPPAFEVIAPQDIVVHCEGSTFAKARVVKYRRWERDGRACRGLGVAC